MANKAESMAKTLAQSGAAQAMAVKGGDMANTEARREAWQRRREARAAGSSPTMRDMVDTGEASDAEVDAAVQFKPSSPYGPKPLGRDDVLGPAEADAGKTWTDPDGKMKYKLLPNGDIDILVGVNGTKGPVLKKGTDAYKKYAGVILATYKGDQPLPEGKDDMPMAKAGPSGSEMTAGAGREAPSYDFGGASRR